MKTPFLNPRLEGLRFDEHSVPLEILKDFSAFEELVGVVARLLYLNENPARRRVPSGFYEGFSLHVSAIQDGSAITIIDQVRKDAVSTFERFFEMARDLTLKTMMAAAIGAPIPVEFPRVCLPYFDQFGKSLRPDERIAMVVPGQSEVAIYSADARKRLVLLGAPEYRQTAVFRGKITAMDTEKKTYTLNIVTGDRLTGTYTAEYGRTVLESFLPKGPKVIVRAIVLYDRNDRPKAIEKIAHMETLESNDVPARLEEISILKDGWLNGEGREVSGNGIRWLIDAWDTVYPEELQKPYAYPTTDGGVQLEWTLGNWELSAKIDLDSKKAELSGLNVATDESIDAGAELANPEGWRSLTEFVQSRSQG